MNWWNILGISYDSDIKTIKKAYSKLLKINNPEDNPEGYQRLREAYDAAIKYAKKNNKENQDVNNNSYENVTSEEEINEKKEEIYENYINEDKKISFQHEFDINKSYHNVKETKINLNNQIMQFSTRLNDIYYDMSLRADSEVWQEFLNSPVIWNTEAFPIIEEELFKFLTAHKYLPAEIWKKLNNNFTWSQNEIKLYDKYSEIIVDEFLKNLKAPSTLKYDYIKTIDPEIADKYLGERQKADEALKNKEYLIAYSHIKKANLLFEGDPELLRLKGDYEYKFEHLKTALEYYKSAFEINSNDLISALNIGTILVEYKNFSEAIPYLRQYLSYNSEDKSALKYIAYCYYYNDDLEMAKEKFQKLKSFDEKDKITKKYLKNIEAQLMGKNIRKIIFDRENFIQKEEVKKENETKKDYKIKERVYGNNNNRFKYLVKFVIIIAILGFIRHTPTTTPVVKTSPNYNNAQNNKISENTNKTANNTNKTSENTNKETVKGEATRMMLDPNKSRKITMPINNIKAIKYYKITEPFEDKSIFSDAELDNNGLRNKVESQLYIGIADNNVMIFTNANFNENTISKEDIYEIVGEMHPMSEEIGTNIKKTYESDYQDYYWISNGIFDASKIGKKSKK